MNKYFQGKSITAGCTDSSNRRSQRIDFLLYICINRCFKITRKNVFLGVLSEKNNQNIQSPIQVINTNEIIDRSRYFKMSLKQYCYFNILCFPRTSNTEKPICCSENSEIQVTWMPRDWTPVYHPIFECGAFQSRLEFTQQSAAVLNLIQWCN